VGGACADGLARVDEGSPAPVWRLVSHPAGDGSWNMAMDDAIARAVGAGCAPPTLRFFAWRQPTLSLGCLQRARDAADMDECTRLRVDVVRRPTGGRAVLHDHELTYSLCLPLRGIWRRLSVAESFRLVGEGLVAGVRCLGIDARLGEGPGGVPGSDRAGACFQVRRMPAILVDGRKLIGSAQRRWDAVMLQHGSLLLDLDLDLHRTVFPAWPGHPKESGVTWLAALLGEVPTRSAVEAAMQAGLETTLAARLVSGEATSEERREADRLVRDQYGLPTWTWRC
jgi:lipoate-protein ligase A